MLAKIDGLCTERERLKAEQGGVIRAVLVKNGEPVEFGQPLFELEPA